MVRAPEGTVTVREIVLRGYLRKTEAAKYLNVSVRTLTDWMQRGLVAFIKISHKVCLFRLSDLDAAMDRRRTRAVGE